MRSLPAVPCPPRLSARPWRRAAWCAVLVTSTASGWGIAAATPEVVQVTQRGRAFQPGELTLQRGATVRFVNDDGALLHHVHSKGDGFSFDTGEQPSGKAIDVRFPTAGTFTVLCGIHPKMRLQVVVR